MANALEKIVARNWSRAVPMSALFELTFVCNHACSFCYNCPTGQKEMTTVEVCEALQKLADFNILYLTLTGGEPLVRMAPDGFLEMFGRAAACAAARREPVPLPRQDAPGEAVCGTGRSSLAIDPYGNIYPCVQWRRSAGNIKELKELKTMWQTSPV